MKILSENSAIRFCMTSCRTRVLIIGSDYQVFHLYWRYYFQVTDLNICGFVSASNEVQALKQFKGLYKAPYTIYPLSKLEKHIEEKRIQKCMIHTSTIPVKLLQSIIHRILSTQKCGVEFLPMKDLTIKSFKPIISITSLTPNKAKTNVSKYICSVLSNAKKKVAVILPMIKMRNSSVLFDINDSPFIEIDGKQKVFTFPISTGEKKLIQQYQMSGVSKLYFTADVRKAVIFAEQKTDIIIVDSYDCSLPFVKSQESFCVITPDVFINSISVSKWPGIVNANQSQNIIMLMNEKDRIDSEKIKLISEEFSQQKIFYLNFNTQRTRSSSENLIARKSISIDTFRKRTIIDNLRDDRVILSMNYADSDEVDYSSLVVHDINDNLKEFVTKYFININGSPLKPHFESQVDILKALSQTSNKELTANFNESSNKEAICKLFLSAHLPVGCRITTGEIFDSFLNCTGRIDLIIVNDCPTLTIDTSDSVIAPVQADAVLSVIEVTTILSQETLNRSITKLRPVKSLMTSYSRIVLPNKQQINDALDGKIVTGIFAFGVSFKNQEKILESLQQNPDVVDFIVALDSCVYFSEKLLTMCGIAVQNMRAQYGYIKFDAKGIGLALMFGVLNSIRSLRKFSGFNLVKYLTGNWGKKESRFGKIVTMNKLRPKWENKY